MSFNYHKNKEHSTGETFWTSYSDLFLGLSTIFLLLYVVSSLRTGTDGIRNLIENQRLTTEVQDLKNQIKMYESIKTDYLQNQAPKTEIQEYQELMDKLTLLQEDAHNENEKLKKQALENQGKEVALNKYQQMIRNIINANKVAKTKIINRNDLITEQDEEIDVQDQQISQLEKNINEKKRLIDDSERKIADANNQLKRKLAEIERARKQNKITAKIYQKQMAKIKEQSENQIDTLRDTTESYQKELAKSQNQLTAMTGQLEEASTKLAAKESEADALQKKIAGLRGEYEAQKVKNRQAFEAELQREKLSAADRAGREAAFRKAAAKKEGELAGKIAGLSGELTRAKAEMDARRNIAQEIKKGFGAAGIKGDIDMETGEVLLDFGDAYFESDSAKLKLDMKQVLQKAMPIYSNSLFGNPKVSKKISAVEVIGFASPTYQGRFVDPNSTAPEDREAMKYNMDLSYRRANSIFAYIIDDKDMKFERQKELIPLMKVSGRSFLEVFRANRELASSQDFCKINDCRKTQRVIIRFSMDAKK